MQARENLERIRKLMVAYVVARTELTEAKVLRSKGSVIGNYAEYLSTVFFPGMILNDSQSETGYDATDRDGCLVEIKGRIKSPKSYLEVSLPDWHWAYLLYFTFSADYELLEMWKISNELAIAAGRLSTPNGSKWNILLTKQLTNDSRFIRYTAEELDNMIQ